MWRHPALAAAYSSSSSIPIHIHWAGRCSVYIHHEALRTQCSALPVVLSFRKGTESSPSHIVSVRGAIPRQFRDRHTCHIKVSVTKWNRKRTSSRQRVSRIQQNLSLLNSGWCASNAGSDQPNKARSVWGVRMVFAVIHRVFAICA